MGYVTLTGKKENLLLSEERHIFFPGTKLSISSHVGLRKGTLSNLMDNVLIPISQQMQKWISCGSFL